MRRPPPASSTGRGHACLLENLRRREVVDGTRRPPLHRTSVASDFLRPAPHFRDVPTRGTARYSSARCIRKGIAGSIAADIGQPAACSHTLVLASSGDPGRRMFREVAAPRRLPDAGRRKYRASPPQIGSWICESRQSIAELALQILPQEKRRRCDRWHSSVSPCARVLHIGIQYAV